MKKIALASTNLYENWYTYNFEYLIECLNTSHNKNKLFFLGKDRTKNLNINLKDINFDFLSNKVDIFIINFSDIFNDKTMNFSIKILKKIEKKSKIIMIVSDPWRFEDKIKKYLKNLNETIWLIHSNHYTELLKKKFPKKIIKMLPYFVGEKYKDMMLKRIYEISFIGRCEIKNKNLKINKFSNYSIFHEETLSKLRKRIIKKKLVNRVFDIVINLNRSVFTYNSYPKIKGLSQIYHTPFRFVESSACGAISIAPFITNELKNFYYPENLIINCNNSYTKIKNILNETDNDKIQKIREKITIHTEKNHKAKNRIKFILALSNEKLGVVAKDFYEKQF